MSHDHGIRKRTGKDAERSGLIVLGMHRSGTSAITGALRLCGAWLGEEAELTAANSENPRGFWERRDIRTICDRLLHASGADWWKIGSFDPNAIPDDVLSEERTNFATIISRLDAHGTWALKEPRLCFLFPILQDLITNPVCIHIFRDPLEVARSLQTRNGFGIATGLALWEAYNRRALSTSEHLPRVLVSYEALISHPRETIGKLLDCLAELATTNLVTPNEDRLRQFIDPTLYRRRADEDESLEYLSPTQLDLWHHYCTGQVFKHEGNVNLPRATAQNLLDLETTQTSFNQHSDRERELTRELAARSRLVEHLQRRTSAMTADLEERRARITSQEATITSQEATITSQGATITSQEATITSHEATILARDATIELRDAAITSQNTKIHELLASTSWRLTAPLRFLSLTYKWFRTTLRRARKLLYWLAKGQFSRALNSFRFAPTRNHTHLHSTKSTPFPAQSSALSELISECQMKNTLARSLRTAVDYEQKTAKISVIAWDMAHNPLGRAYLLADLLKTEYDVEIVGALFPQFGTELWGPLRSCSRVTMKFFPGSDFPDHFTRMEEIAHLITGDIIYVSKPRLPGVELGILAKLHRNRPIVLDVDDYELSFFRNRSPLTLEEAALNSGSRDYNRPQAETWTRYCESLVPLFDQITVSNEELQKKFGGVMLPHVRSELDFDPSAYPRNAIRAELGFRPEDKVILFAGTLRMHKGVERIVDAVKKLPHLNCKLMIVGTAPDIETRHFLRSLDTTYVRAIPDVPFHDLPGYLSAGDLVCLLQDPSNVTAQFQTPAKFTDALAMGIPILASNAPPLVNLARDGLVELLGSTPLETKLQDMISNYTSQQQRAQRNREHFLKHYSYAACRPCIKEILDRLLAIHSPTPAEFRGLIDNHRKLYSGNRESSTAPKASLTVQSPNHKSRSGEANTISSVAPRKPKSRVYVDDNIDVVFFWKQNDTGLYGRRQDMLVRHLIKHPRIQSIYHFDAPLHLLPSIRDALRNGWSAGHSHARFVLFNAIRRRYFRGRWTSVRSDTFVFLAKARASRLVKWLVPCEDDYVKYLERVFKQHNVGERRLILWVCPNNFYFPSIERRLEPDLVVADVIDDQRKWNVTTRRRRDLDTNYQEILGRSDLVFVNCDTVLRSMNEFANNIHLFPNAVEKPHSNRTLWKKPVELARLTGPVIGYAGNLDIARIDLELLETLAADQPDWNLVFLGSMHRGREMEGLSRFRNVHFLGVRIYERAIQYIKHFDVAIIPHLDNELTRSMSPLKLYVYLSLQVPVVTTQIENMDDVKEFVRVGRTPKEFIQAVRKCLESDLNGPASARLERSLSKNSWDERVADMMRLIEDELELRFDSSQ